VAVWDDKFGLRDLDLFNFRMGYLMYKKVTPTKFGGFFQPCVRVYVLVHPTMVTV
jgi:hypothetical protein